METKSNTKLIASIIIGIVIAIFLIVIFPFYTVNPGERAIVLRFGEIKDVKLEGFHYKVPFIDEVVMIDIQIQKEQVSASAASKDLQTVDAEIALNYLISSVAIRELYTNIGDEDAVKIKIIDPAIQEAVKAATAKYTAEELITKRAEVRDVMKNLLTERLANEYITVKEVSIVNFNFSAGFNRAIEAKVTAEQEALAAKNKLEQVKYEAEQKIATAKADAENIRLQSQAANNEKYVSLKALDVQMEMAKRWNGVLPQNLYGSAPIPFLPLSN